MGLNKYIEYTNLKSPSTEEIKKFVRQEKKINLKKKFKQGEL